MFIILDSMIYSRLVSYGKCRFVENETLFRLVISFFILYINFDYTTLFLSLNRYIFINLCVMFK
jgi:hypothetical protein